MGSASPFNVITKAMTLRVFAAEEVAELYAQHTAATGQVFEPEAVRLAVEFSGGQPLLVNALARWCVEEIHGERYGETITAADMCEAKEKIVRERGTHLDSLMESNAGYAAHAVSVTDYEGGPRRQGTRIDIGHIELPPKNGTVLFVR